MIQHVIERRLLAVSVVLISSFAASVTLAEPFGVRLTYFDDPSTSVAISWNSDNPADNEVVYGTSSSVLDQTLAATESHVLPDPLGTSFTARLEGLDPETTYFYRVGQSTGALHPWGSPYSFKTMSAEPCDSFRFVVIGDNRADFDNIGPSAFWAGILAEAMLETPSFFVNTGDMVKNGEEPVEWEGFIDESETGMARVPSILTMGNHDEDNVSGDDALYNRLFDLPRNDRVNLEDYYSLDIGSVHFVSLSTQFVRPGSETFSEMVAWLRDDLEANQKPWIVVFFHKAVYSRGNHSSGEEEDGAINATFIPIFDEFDVDLVFNGHSHDYERYVPSVGVDREFGGSGRTFPAGDQASFGDPSVGVPDGSTGTTYVVTGGAGALTTDVFGFTCLDAACTYCTGFNLNCAEEVFQNDRDASVVYGGEHNFVIVDVSPERLDIRAYATMTGNVDGEFTLDSFFVTNDDLDPTVCGEVLEETGVEEPEPDASIEDLGDPDSDMAGVDDGSSIPDGDAPETIDAPTTDSAGDSETGPGVDDVSDETSHQKDGCCSTADKRGDWPTVLLALALGALLLVRRFAGPLTPTLSPRRGDRNEMK